MTLHKVKSPYYETHRKLVQLDIISKLVNRASLLNSIRRVHDVSTNGNTTIILCEEDDLRD